MMKQQPCATKLNLSKLCRIVMALALLKISFLVAMVWDLSSLNITAPTFFDTSVIAKEENTTPTSIMTVSNNLKKIQQQIPKGQLVELAEQNAYSNQLDATQQTASMGQQSLIQQVNPQDISNWDINNGTFPVSKSIQGEKNYSPSFFASNNDVSLKYELLSAGIDDSSTPSPQANANNTSWWENMLNIKNLPIPGFGTASVAHAAALDNVPAPNIAPSTGVTNFTPNSQKVGEGENLAQEMVLASNTAPIAAIAAGAAGPQVNYQNSDSIPPTIAPPAPNINSYAPASDSKLMQKELARREQELLMLKKQMEQRYSELKEAEDRVNKLLENADKATKQKSSSLISLYANMKPKQAAIALGKIDERVAVQILSGLKPKQAGEILSYADPEVTAKLTELLTRIQQ